MAPGSVRTIPPWVIQRPPPAVPPQHNHAPSETRHAHDISDSSRDGTFDNDDSQTFHGSNSNDNKSNGSGSGANNTGNAPRDEPDADGIYIAADGAKDPAAPITTRDETPGRGIRHRLSHLFLHNEGRRWDHLRSAEPVIVPQYHVVTRPAEPERQDSDYPDSQATPGPRGQLDGETNGKGSGAGASAGASAGAGAGAGTSTGVPTMPFATGSGGPHHTASVRRKAQAPLGSSGQEQHPWWYNPQTQWRSFIESSRYPHLRNEKSMIINDEEMARLHPDFGYHTTLRPKVGGGDGGGGMGHFHDNHSAYMSGKPFYKRIWQTLLHHPLGPLACRLTVLMTSIVALVLAATIYRRENLGHLHLGKGNHSSDDFDSVWLADRQQERTQIIVAIVIDVVAIPYIGYITADDYTGKPLGLRRPQERIRLLLTDLFFIIFKSASTALGFEAMIFFTTEGSEGLMRALGAFELIGLISWALTLTINIFREIERLVGK